MQERLRIWGTLLIFLVVLAATIVLGMQNKYADYNGITVTPGAVEAELVLERAALVDSYQQGVKILRDGEVTYYLDSQGTWGTERPDYLDENDQVQLTEYEEAYAERRAEESALNNTIVGSSPAWMGFGSEAVTFEENSDRFRMFEAMLWMGFLCSMPLYALLFKRKQKQFDAGAWGLTLVGLFILGLLPLILMVNRPTIYAVAYAVPLISMMLLWRLTHEKKVPPTPASTELASA